MMRKKTFNATQTIVLGFFIVILIGAVILSLPVSSSKGTFTPFIDSLFTAVTSVCVTGLTVVTVAEQFNLFGHIIILILIQLGGLGVVCCGVGVLMLLHKKIDMKNRLLIQTSYNLSSMDGLTHFVLWVIKLTFIIEGIGMLLYAIVFVP